MLIEVLDLAVSTAWEARDDDAGESVLHPESMRWDEDPAIAEFARLTGEVTFARGEGLPGRVWESGEAMWIDDVTTDENFPRREAAKAAGLRSAVCMPVRSERGVIAVLEGFMIGRREIDHDLVPVLGMMGVGLGQLIERHRAERSEDDVERRHRAILSSSRDGVITMNASGEVVEFNPAAEKIFGFTSLEAVGNPVADLIIPPARREAHRSGLKRYLETGEAKLLGRRTEIDAVDSRGRQFPVELTITEIDTPGEPMFTAFLRDITDRLRSERELRESRRRLVEAADAGRRQIERDLHDGAQNQLVSVAMSLGGARTALESDPAEAAEMLDEVSADLEQAITELRELARGIHPAILTEGGLTPALQGLARRSTIPVRLGDVPDGRFPPRVEAAAYFIATEALTNAARHAAGADRVEIEMAVTDGALIVEVSDDGPGGANVEGGGLRGLADRVAALGGTFEVDSPPGSGTRLRAAMPCE